MIGTTANSAAKATEPAVPPSQEVAQVGLKQPPEGARVRVLALVYNELVRYGLGTMLSRLPMVEHFDLVDERGEAARMLGAGRYDVAILPCGEECVQLDPEAARAGARVLLLLTEVDHQHVGSVARNKCDGFLLQSELTASSLHDALARLVHGELPMPSSLARELLSHARRNESPRPSRPIVLTPREREALTLIVEGLSNKQIARRLGISEHGAKRHVATVLAKLNCPNRALAVAIALREKLLHDG
jgi:two-component system nitrate/nitrite response regulator NarL